MLEVNATKILGDFTLNVNFTHERGILSIIGSSGCGKSMTLKCIAGLITPDSGTITINDKTLYSTDSKINIPARLRKIGFVFQNSALFPHMSVYKNIEYGISDKPRKIREQAVKDIIERTHLNGLGKRFPYQLSGGQQQRCALARTLVTEPEILLLDEPFSAADGHTKHILESELITIIKHNFHKPVLLVTHNIEEAYRLSDRIMIIENGRCVQTAAKDKVIDHPASVNAARITGCKNIFPADIISSSGKETLIKCGEITIRAAGIVPINDNVYIGIRAHYINILSEQTSEKNIFPCKIIEVIEGIFSTTVITECGGNLFRAEISKTSEALKVFRKNKKLFIQIPPEKIFFTTE